MSQSVIAPEMLAGEFLFKRYGATTADYDHAADEDTRLELLNGVLIMHSPANVRHENLFWFLGSLMRGYVAKQGLGVVLGSRTAMFLEPERRLEPDLLFVQTAHLGRLGDVALMGPADLVVEILSPATRDYDLNEKRRAYAAAGVREYWMVDPASSPFLADCPAGVRVAELTKGRYRSHALPGLWLDVEWLWREPLPDAGLCIAEILQ